LRGLKKIKRNVLMPRIWSWCYFQPTRLATSRKRQEKKEQRLNNKKKEKEKKIVTIDIATYIAQLAHPAVAQLVAR